jgi:hypothetical protein
MRWGRFARSHRVVGAMVFPSWQLWYSSAAVVGQLLPQWGEAVHFWMLLSGSGNQLCDPQSCPPLESGLLPACCQPLLPFLCLFIESSALSLAPGPTPFSGAGLALHLFCVWLQFTVLQFRCGGSVCPGAELAYVPGGR